ncbi:glutamyl-tRNA synthetase [Asticcacaulis biprosthecium C19]|uniref:Glutamyl-tRNA synthetase n=1 Tax=Asticcacaulis biprosthecium C19 TaxID=715226 RepID=F4QTY0_9CAUL|nr:tRNA glutamyl-Q(34) synthetase GluQRS [Asticcacaulis biprosthecium]EGF89280.1 glutamyl-tRNA synthetase [Asticcacaulis biprosthecium C19]
MTVRTRFAPSPTGYLHLGHAFSALTAYGFARDHRGDFILRIEDIDHTRCRPQFEQAIFDDLAWLGIAWETPVLRQSEHLADYQAALDRLRDMGVLYADSRTRKGQAEAALSAPQGDDNTETSPAPPAWRLSLDAARARLGARYDALQFTDLNAGDHPARPEINGDVILGRKDIGVAYHLAVVVDDARQDITHVVRGQDLFDATHTQVLLQALLDLPTPQYLHHTLVLDDQGRRLAKRKGSKSLRDYRDGGRSSDDILALLDITAKA